MDLGMTILRPASRSPEKGAETLVWLATSPDVANVSGGYFSDQEQSPLQQTGEIAARPREAFDEARANRVGHVNEYDQLSKFRGACLGFRIVLGQAHQHPDAPYPLRLLRVRRERPYATAAPPSSVMKSRLFIQSPRRRGQATWAAPRGRASWLF